MALSNGDLSSKNELNRYSNRKSNEQERGGDQKEVLDRRQDFALIVFGAPGLINRFVFSPMDMC
jgi:hypothetical protein